jgi:hypothetical protein
MTSCYTNAARPPLERHARITNWHQGGLYVVDAYLFLDGPVGSLYNTAGHLVQIDQGIWRDLLTICLTEREAYYTGLKNPVSPWPGLQGVSGQGLRATQSQAMYMQPLATSAYMPMANTRLGTQGMQGQGVRPTFVQLSDGQIAIQWGQQNSDLGTLGQAALSRGYNPPAGVPPVTTYFPVWR